MLYPFFKTPEYVAEDISMPTTILLIEDDVELQDLLTTYLEGFEMQVRATASPETGLELVQSLEPDLVILDVMLPGMNGFEVCRRIRQMSDVPVIMLTARGDVMDRVVGLEIGADDYVPKPFEPRELVARIQSILRRSRRSDNTIKHHFGNLTIDSDARAALLDNKDIHLTTTEFNALSLLIKTPGKVIDRDGLLQALRGLEADATNRSVDITMSRLRQKLNDDPKEPKFIKTIWGVGYMFIANETTHV